MLSQQEIDDARKLAEEWEAREATEDLAASDVIEFEVDLRRDLLHPRLVVLTHQPETCPRCGGELRDVAIEYMTRIQSGLVVIRDVPVLRCLSQGHEFLLETTLDRLEALIEPRQTERVEPKEMLQIPVFQLLRTA